MSSRGRKRATPDEGVNFALERLRDGQDGRAGSLSNVIARVSALERAMKAGARAGRWDGSRDAMAERIIIFQRNATLIRTYRRAPLGAASAAKEALPRLLSRSLAWQRRL